MTMLKWVVYLLGLLTVPHKRAFGEIVAVWDLWQPLGMD